MQTFTDTKNRNWGIRLSMLAMERVRAKLGLDLRYPTDPETTAANPKPSLIGRLSTDPLLFSSLLTTLLDSQIREANISLDQFAEDLDGHTIGNAQEAFFKEWADFFLGLRSPHLVELMEAERTLLTRAGQMIIRKVAAINPDEELARLLESTTTGSSASGPESSESTPAD